jgi:hypothetical protein
VHSQKIHDRLGIIDVVIIVLLVRTWMKKQIAR